MVAAQIYAAEFRFAAPVKGDGLGVGFTVVFGGAVGLLDVEFRNGAMELVWVAFLEKMVNVGITRVLPVELVVGVEGGTVGVDGGTVGVDFGTVGLEAGTVGIETCTFGIDVGTGGAGVDTVIVTPALSQRLLVTSIVS